MEKTLALAISFLMFSFGYSQIKEQLIGSARVNTLEDTGKLKVRIDPKSRIQDDSLTEYKDSVNINSCGHKANQINKKEEKKLKEHSEIFGLHVRHSAIFAACISLLTIAIGFFLNWYAKKINNNTKHKFTFDYIIRHLNIIDKKIDEQLNYLKTFKGLVGKAGSKLTISPIIEFDFASNRESMMKLIYSRLLLKDEEKSELFYNIEKYLRATEKTWEVFEEMIELLRTTREKDYQAYHDSELEFLLSLFKLDHSNPTKDQPLNSFFAHQKSLQKTGDYNQKFNSYYKKIKDYCLNNGDTRFGGILETFFKIESAHHNLKSFDDQFLGMLDNRINELATIKDELTKASNKISNAKMKWVVIP